MSILLRVTVSQPEGKGFWKKTKGTEAEEVGDGRAEGLSGTEDGSHIAGGFFTS